MEHLGANIKAARLKAGLTQSELATAVETTKAAISRYEAGKRTPSDELVRSIASVLHTTLVELYFGITAEQLAQQYTREYEAHEEELEDYYYPGLTKDLVAAFRKLNADGQRKAIERVEELTEIAKYLDQNAG